MELIITDTLAKWGNKWDSSCEIRLSPPMEELEDPCDKAWDREKDRRLYAKGKEK